MTIIQKALVDIRELRTEELDLVGGAYSAEPTLILTSTGFQVCHQHGCTWVTAMDDAMSDMNND